VTQGFYFIAFNLILVPQFLSYLNESFYASNVTNEPN